MEMVDRDVEWVENLVHAALSGSSEAQGKLLDYYRPMMVHRLRQRMYPDIQAKVGASDLYQEACLQALRDLADFRGQSSAEFRKWLWRILVHNLHDWHRHYRGTHKRDLAREVASADRPTDPRVRAQIVSPDLPPDEQAILNEEWVRLQEVMCGLTAWECTLVEWRFREGWSYEEICQHLEAAAPADRPLQATPDAVRMFLKRLCRKVRVRLESGRWPGQGKVAQGKEPESKPVAASGNGKPMEGERDGKAGGGD